LTKGDQARFNTTNHHDAGAVPAGLTGAEGPVARPPHTPAGIHYALS
jgi:hypothetical protein